MIKTLVSEFDTFFSKADGRLNPDSALGDVIKLTIGANYFRLPKYLHGDLIGKDGTIVELSAYELVAALLNGLKDFGTGALIEQNSAGRALQQRRRHARLDERAGPVAAHDAKGIPRGQLPAAEHGRRCIE